MTREHASFLRISRTLPVLLALCVLTIDVPASLADPDAAHRIAEKFSDTSKRDLSSEQKAEEAEMLARARSEAAEKERAEKAETEARLIAEAERADGERKAAEAAQAERLRIAEEQEVVERARKDAEARKIAAEALRQLARQKEEAEAQRQLQAAREEENRQLLDKLRRIREQRAADAARRAAESAIAASEAKAPDPSDLPAAPPPMALGKPPEPTTMPEPVAALAEHLTTRVTVLLAMDPGNRGIRRFEKTADPVLCIGERCYVSTGPATAANMMTRGKAFGPGNTLGKRAGACRHSLSCVFRGVDLGAETASIQPIDLKILRHDRREPSEARADGTCALRSGRLMCEATILAKDYRAWIVPEDVAEAAGADALTAAVAGGFRETQAALGTQLR